MTVKGPQTLAQLLQSGDIARLRDEAAARQEMLRQVRALLPPEEARHLVAASADAAGRLVLSMDSAVWAARVRYRARELGRDKLRVRVVPRGTGV